MNCGKNDEHILKCSEKCGSSPKNIGSPFEAIHILNGFTKFPDLSFIFGFNTLQDITSTLYIYIDQNFGQDGIVTRRG